MRGLAVVVALAACRYGFDGDVTRDASPSVIPRCWPDWKSGQLALSAPTRIAELDAGENPTLSSDDRTMYFEQAHDIYVTHRTAPGAAWNAPLRLDALATAATESRLTTTADGTLAVFTSDRGGNPDLWTSDPGGNFGSASTGCVANLDTADSELDPELTPDGLALYYAPYDGTNQRIVVATRATPAEMFGNPRTLAELQISVAVADPAVSPDELVIAFSSGVTEADNDLYYATRASRDEPFGAASRVPAVNLPGIDDGDVELSRDGCELIFMSDRGGTKQLYVSHVLE